MPDSASPAWQMSQYTQSTKNYCIYLFVDFFRGGGGFGEGGGETKSGRSVRAVIRVQTKHLHVNHKQRGKYSSTKVTLKFQQLETCCVALLCCSWFSSDKVTRIPYGKKV